MSLRRIVSNNYRKQFNRCFQQQRRHPLTTMSCSRLVHANSSSSSSSNSNVFLQLNMQRHRFLSTEAGTAPSVVEAGQELLSVCEDETRELNAMLNESRDADTFLSDFQFSKVTAPAPLIHLQKQAGPYTVDVLFNPSDGQDAAADEFDQDDDDDDDIEEDIDDEEGFEGEEEDDEFDDGPDVKVLIQVSRGDNDPALHVDGFATADGTLQLESFWFELPSLGQAAAAPESQEDLEHRLNKLADGLDDVDGDFDDVEPASVNLDSLSPEFETPFYQFMETLGITDDLALYVNEQTAVWDAERTVDALTQLGAFVAAKK